MSFNDALASVLDEIDEINAHSSSLVDFRHGLHERYQRSALAYVSLRDIGYLHPSILNSKAQDTYLNLGDYYYAAANRRRKNLFQYLSNLFATDLNRYLRESYRITNLTNLPDRWRFVIEQVNSFLAMRQNTILNILALLPSKIVHSRGLSKFIRAFFGCIFVYVTISQNPTTLDKDFLELALLFSISFLVLDGIFDDSSLLPSRYRDFFFFAAKQNCSKDIESRPVIPTFLFKELQLLVDTAHQNILFCTLKQDFLSFIESQFSQKVNARLDPSSSIDNLLLSSAEQAFCTRFCVIRMAGASPGSRWIARLRHSGLLNQLSNDLEGYFDDKFHFTTIFTHNSHREFAFSTYIREATKFVYMYDEVEQSTVMTAQVLRFLEAIRELPRKHETKISTLVAEWNAKGSLRVPPEIIERILDNRHRFFRLHREHRLVDSLAAGLHNGRVKRRRTYTLDRRRFSNLQDRYGIAVEAVLREFIKSDYGKYVLNGRASRFRSYIFLMFTIRSRFCEGDKIKLAAAIEMFHTASLIIDDLPEHDNAQFRRGLPCVHVRFGNSIAHLTAVEFITSAYSAILSISLPNAKERICSIVDRHVSPIFGLIRGQLDDLESRNRVSVSKMQYLRIAARKTGSAFAFSFELGAITAYPDMSRSELLKLRRIAILLGILYQIADDLEDEFPLLDRDALTAIFRDVTQKIEILLDDIGSYDFVESCCIVQRNILIKFNEAI